MFRSHTLIAADDAQRLLCTLCVDCPLQGGAGCALMRGCARFSDGLCSMLACGGSLHLLCESETPDALKRTEAAIAARVRASLGGELGEIGWNRAA